LGAEAWTSVACEKLSGWVRRATIPAEHLQEPGIEAAFDIGGAPVYGPFTVTVAAIPEPRVTPVPAVARAIPKRFRITATEGDRVTSVVEWDDLPGVDFYRVYRDGELACETAVSAFPDFPEQRESTYRVEAVRAGEVVAESNELRFQAPERAPKQAVEVRAALRPDHVRVIWSALQSPNVASYRLERRGAGASPWKEVAVKDAATAGWMSYADRPEPGEWAYRVTPLSATGLEGPPAEASVDFQPGLAEEPVLDLPLTERPAEAEVVGEVGFSDEGARFGAGYLELPHRPGFEVGRAMTLAFEFKADRVGEMSVLLSHGGYSVNGWFAQILNGRLLIRMRDGDGQGAVIQPGAWYEAVFVYDGVRPFVRINGEWIPQRGQPVSTVDTSVPLRIGTYQHDEPPYRFHGLLKNVRIYDGIAVELPE
jgi:hypothetical protein